MLEFIGKATLDQQLRAGTADLSILTFQQHIDSLAKALAADIESPKLQTRVTRTIFGIFKQAGRATGSSVSEEFMTEFYQELGRRLVHVYKVPFESVERVVGERLPLLMVRISRLDQGGREQEMKHILRVRGARVKPTDRLKYAKKDRSKWFKFGRDVKRVITRAAEIGATDIREPIIRAQGALDTDVKRAWSKEDARQQALAKLRQERDARLGKVTSTVSDLKTGTQGLARDIAIGTGASRAAELIRQERDLWKPHAEVTRPSNPYATVRKDQEAAQQRTSDILARARGTYVSRQDTAAKTDLQSPSSHIAHAFAAQSPKERTSSILQAATASQGFTGTRAAQVQQQVDQAKRYGTSTMDVVGEPTQLGLFTPPKVPQSYDPARVGAMTPQRQPIQTSFTFPTVKAPEPVQQALPLNYDLFSRPKEPIGQVAAIKRETPTVLKTPTQKSQSPMTTPPKPTDAQKAVPKTGTTTKAHVDKDVKPDYTMRAERFRDELREALATKASETISFAMRPPSVEGESWQFTIKDDGLDVKAMLDFKNSRIKFTTFTSDTAPFAATVYDVVKNIGLRHGVSTVGQYPKVAKNVTPLSTTSIATEPHGKGGEVVTSAPTAREIPQTDASTEIETTPGMAPAHAPVFRRDPDEIVSRFLKKVLGPEFEIIIREPSISEAKTFTLTIREPGKATDLATIDFTDDTKTLRVTTMRGSDKLQRRMLAAIEVLLKRPEMVGWRFEAETNQKVKSAGAKLAGVLSGETFRHTFGLGKRSAKAQADLKARQAADVEKTAGPIADPAGSAGVADVPRVPATLPPVEPRKELKITPSKPVQVSGPPPGEDEYGLTGLASTFYAALLTSKDIPPGLAKTIEVDPTNTGGAFSIGGGERLDIEVVNSRNEVILHVLKIADHLVEGLLKVVGSLGVAVDIRAELKRELQWAAQDAGLTLDKPAPAVPAAEKTQYPDYTPQLQRQPGKRAEAPDVSDAHVADLQKQAGEKPAPRNEPAATAGPGLVSVLDIVIRSLRAANFPNSKKVGGNSVANHDSKGLVNVQQTPNNTLRVAFTPFRGANDEESPTNLLRALANGIPADIPIDVSDMITDAQEKEWPGVLKAVKDVMSVHADRKWIT